MKHIVNKTLIWILSITLVLPSFSMYAYASEIPTELSDCENTIIESNCNKEMNDESCIVYGPKVSASNALVDKIIAFAKKQIHSDDWSGYCQAFVKACYEAAGIKAKQNASTATEAKKWWRVSNDLSNIPVGACVYWYDNHVAIYLGNDRIIHTVSGVYKDGKPNVSYVEETSLSYYINRGKIECWGYQAGYDLYENKSETSNIFASVTTSDITKTSAKINAKLNGVYAVSKCGFYYGTSKSKLTRVVENANTKVQYLWYSLGNGSKWLSTLKEGTKYYYAFYIVLDGKEYISEVKSFTTKGTATVKNVEMVSYPSKRDYVVGEKIDTTGAKLKLTYSDGSTKTITSGMTVSGDTSKVGKRQILLKYDGKTFKYDINVTQPLKNITLNKTNVVLDVDDVISLKVTYNPNDTTDNKDVTWKSSNTSVVTVSKGTITAVGAGTATVTATCGGKTATCDVTVNVPVEGVTLNKEKITLTVEGEKANLVAKILPNNASNKKVNWLSSDINVATVSENGVVQAVGEGEATISVITEAGNMKAVCRVVVEYSQSESEKDEENNQQTIGWQKNEKGWRYRNSNGNYLKDCWEFISGNWYAFDSHGYMRKGWFKDEKVWYYLNPNSGHMLTGWQYIDGIWYYLHPNGAMATGWIIWNDAWYYLHSGGAMATGWIVWNDAWYYLHSGGAMATGWIIWNGNWYYLDSNGKMASNTWIGNYYVNSSGVWVQ